MLTLRFRCLLALLGSCVLFLPQSMSMTITGAGVTMDITDFTGLGDEGFWFANFGLVRPVSGEPVDSNDVNGLPSWVVPDFDSTSPDYSFGDVVTSSGGVFPWNTFRLPNGAVGLSGSLVDPEADDNSNNTIKDLRLGPGTPSSFIMHVIVDNTLNQHNPANRIRARAESGDGVFDEDFRYEPGTAAFNGIADIYSFRYDGWGGYGFY